MSLLEQMFKESRKFNENSEDVVSMNYTFEDRYGDTYNIEAGSAKEAIEKFKKQYPDSSKELMTMYDENDDTYDPETGDILEDVNESVDPAFDESEDVEDNDEELDEILDPEVNLNIGDIASGIDANVDASGASFGFLDGTSGSTGGKEESTKSRKKKMKEAKSSDSEYEVYQVVMDIAVPAGEEKPSYSQGYGNQKFLSAINRALDDLGYVLAGDMIEADDVTDVYRDDVGFDEIWNEIHNESLKESDLSRDLDDFQSWVDYDMKHYGKISKQTRREVEEAGLKIVKDKFGDYEVIV